MLFPEHTSSNLELQNKLDIKVSTVKPFLYLRNLPGWDNIALEYYQASSGIIEQQLQDRMVLIFFSAGIVELFYTYRQSCSINSSYNKGSYLEGNREFIFKKQFCDNTESYSVVPGSIILVPVTIFTQISWLQLLDFAVLILKPSGKGQIPKKLDLVEPKPQFEQFDSLAYTLMSSLLTEKDGDITPGEVKYNCQKYDFYAETLLKTLTIHLFQRYSSVLIQPSENPNLPPKIQKAIAYIQENIDKKLYIEEIAAVVNISKYYFCKLFKQSMGISPYQYLLQQKIEYSKSLLQEHSQLSLAEISLKCGFANQSHFSKCFRQYTGATPKAYRERISNSKMSWF